jgi:hypothetical protein
MLRFTLVALFVALCSCNDNCFQKFSDKNIDISDGDFTVISDDETLPKVNKATSILETVYANQYEILEAIRIVTLSELGVDVSYLKLRNFTNEWCFQTKGRLSIHLTEHISSKLHVYQRMRYLVPNATFDQTEHAGQKPTQVINNFTTVTPIVKESTDISSEKVTHKPTTKTVVVNDSATSAPLSRQIRSTTATQKPASNNSPQPTTQTLVEETTSSNIQEIITTTVTNISSNVSNSTKSEGEEEKVSVVIIIEAVFGILACFAIVLGLIVFVSKLVKERRNENLY